MHRNTKRQDEALRIVAIGGGTGLSTLLLGLKRAMHCGASTGTSDRDIDLTAVVTVADDGGSSGRLRREFDILAPGDIRNCLVAMSEDDALLSRLFQYRFAAGRGLKGHTLGNLLLTALTDLSGDFPTAVQHASDVLAICGRIYPSTAANVCLSAVLEDGTRVEGETRISKSKARIRRVRMKPANAKPMPETLEALSRADVITFGPGSLFTSIIPNLLVKGIAEAIAASPAKKIYFVNLMWQPGETMGFSAADHIRAIHEHAGRKIIDVAVLNTAPLPETLRERYAKELAMPVEHDVPALTRMGIEVVARELTSEGPKIRHSPAKIADVAIELATAARRRTPRAMTA